jgi:hypothetical protein
MLHREVRQNRYRLRAKLINSKLKAQQYRHKSGYVATPTAGRGLKSHMPEGKKK